MSTETPDKTALIVDDEPAVRMLLERVIELLGIQSHSVGSMEEALALIDSQTNLSMAFVDLYLPSGLGWDILAKLRQSEHTRNIPIVLMTGMTLNSADRQRLLDYNATLLDKGGFNVATIRTLIADMLAGTD